MDVRSFGSIGALGMTPVLAYYGDGSAAHSLINAIGDPGYGGLLPRWLRRKKYRGSRGSLITRVSATPRAVKLARLQLKRAQVMKQAQRFRRGQMLRRRGLAIMGSRGPQGYSPPRGYPQGTSQPAPSEQALEDMDDAAVIEDDMVLEEEPAPSFPWGWVLVGAAALVAGAAYMRSQKSRGGGGARRTTGSGEMVWDADKGKMVRA